MTARPARRRWVTAAGVGLALGLAVVFTLVLTHGLRMQGALTGTGDATTTRTLGVTVLRSTWTPSPDGGHSVTLTPTVGLLLPLLAPVLLTVGGHAAVRRHRTAAPAGA